MYTIYQKYALAWLDLNTITLISMIGSSFYLKNQYLSTFQKSRFRLETLCGSSLLSPEQFFKSQLRTTHQNLLSLVQLIESCLVWIIDTYKSTWRCLIQLSIQVVLSFVTQIAEPAQNIIQGVSSIFHLPQTTSNWTQSLNSLQSKINEWFDNDKELIRKAIDPLFQSLQSQINATFDTSSLMMQQDEKIPVTVFCDTMTTTIIDPVEHEINAAITIVIGGIASLLLVCILVNIATIRFRYKRVERAHTLFMKQAPTKDETTLTLLLDRYLRSAYTSPWQQKSRLIHFMGHPMIVYCGVLGLGGLCMILLINSLLETKLRHALFNEGKFPMLFAELNQSIEKLELSLNQHVFGVVRSLAMTVNEKLSKWVNEIENVLHTILGGTFLETPIQGLAKCLVINKVESVEQGLAWIVKSPSLFS